MYALVTNSSRKTHKWLKVSERQAICVRLLKSCKENGKPKRELMTVIAAEYGVEHHTVSRLWDEAQVQMKEKGTLDMNRRLVGNCGPKKVELDFRKVMEIELRYRSTIRSLAKQLGWSKSTTGRKIKEGLIIRHSNAIKPHLTEKNKKERVGFCLSMIEKVSSHFEPKFIDFHDYVHVDEKWFYLTREAQKYYMLPEEMDPLRTCKSKRFITKVMFLTVVGRPWFDLELGIEFDGKIGIFPFVFEEPAQRSSINRPAGTLETKSIHSVTKDVYRSFLIEKVLPAILEKWPHSSSNYPILIQQDNARSHIQVTDLEFNEAATNIGLNVKLVCQPPNSPDLNVLDLGYFRAIEALQQQEAMVDINELIAAVEKSFMELPSSSLNYIFITLQQCMIEVLKVKGSQKYKIPHMNKSMLQRQGLLPRQLPLEVDLINNSMTFFHE